METQPVAGAATQLIGLVSEGRIAWNEEAIYLWDICDMCGRESGTCLRVRRVRPPKKGETVKIASWLGCSWCWRILFELTRYFVYMGERASESVLCASR